MQRLLTDQYDRLYKVEEDERDWKQVNNCV